VSLHAWSHSDSWDAAAVGPLVFELGTAELLFARSTITIAVAIARVNSHSYRLARYTDVVNFIEKYIRDSGISQSELARRLGVSQPTVSDWISGKKTPSGDKVLLLSREMGISVERVLKSLYGE
jgi:predicted XRE-type DNA-binding protein